MSDREPWSGLLTIEDIVELHEEGIQRYGGDLSDPHNGCLERSLGAAWNLELYTATENAVHCLHFCSGLLYYLVKNHCFTDGNKRVAWASAMESLRSLGLTVAVTDDEAQQFCEDIIAGKVAHAIDVVPWIAQRLEEFPVT